MPKLMFNELTREDIAEVAADATVIVPVGSTEQHGRHLPACTDVLIVTEIAERAATLAGGEVPVVLTPTLPFGFASHHLGTFGGTISIGMKTYLEMLTDIGESLAVDGFRRILYLNGHGGNDASIRAVGDRLVFERGVDAQVGASSYWVCAADALAQLGLDFGGPVPGHAGGFETSCVLALRPELVRTERSPAVEQSVQPVAQMAMRNAEVRRSGVWEASDGRTDDASRASPELGDEALDAIAREVGRLVVAFHTSTGIAY